MGKGPTLEAQFADLTDPRRDHALRHKLLDVVIIGILAVICGAEGWTDMELYGKSKEAWLRRFPGRWRQRGARLGRVQRARWMQRDPCSPNPVSTSTTWTCALPI